MTERKMFEEYLFSTEKFKFRNKAFLFMLDENGEYEDQPVLEHWKTWQASTQREGFKFVPVEMGYQDAEKLASKEWELTKGLFMSLNRDLSTIEVEEYRLRWHKNKVYQIMGEYKAMIGAIDE